MAVSRKTAAAPKAAAKPKKSAEIDIVELKRAEAIFWLVGDAPFYCNRMAEKAKRELLLPRGSLTKAEKATKLKHAPLKEYRDSPYMRRGAGGKMITLSEGAEQPPTLLQMIGSAPKKAVATAALDMPSGVTKAEINRMVSAPSEFVALWGVPRLDMSVVRMAGISRTPDIRTRARIDRWAMRVPLRWIEPMLSAKKVGQLVFAAGFLCGLGDWRQEKGGGSNGLFHWVPEDDEELLQIIEEGGYTAQLDAIQNPICANGETEDLLDWYIKELKDRGIDPEQETPEDVEVENADAEDENSQMFGAAEEIVVAPRPKVGRLRRQNGPETAI